VREKIMANRELTTIRGEVLSWRAPNEGRPGAFRIDWDNSTVELTVWPDRATGDVPNSIKSMNPDSLVGATVQIVASYKGEYSGIDQYVPVGSKPIRLVSQATPESNGRVARKLASQPPEGAAVGNAISTSNDAILRMWSLLGRPPTDEELTSHITQLHLGKELILGLRVEPQQDTTPSVEEVAEAGDDDPIFVV